MSIGGPREKHGTVAAKEEARAEVEELGVGSKAKKNKTLS